MKVLVVTHTNDMSGANKSLLSIVDNLSKNKNVEFEFVLNQKKGELSDFLEQQQYKTHYFKYSWWFSNNRVSKIKSTLLFLISFLKFHFLGHISTEFVDYIKKNNFDLIYTNTSTVNFGFRLAKKSKLPHIWHFREFGEEDFGLKKLCTKRYFDNNLRKTEKIIVISKALENKYEQIIPKNKISVIYNGFNTKKMSGVHRIVNDGYINIVVVGQVCEAKCQIQAIKACAKLVNEKKYRVRLFLVGQVDRSYLKSGFPNYKSLDWLVLVGRIDNVFEFRNKMDIELICSRSEAFGRVTLEAMLHELPVIASNKGCNLELVKPNETGLLYNFNDIDDLERKIINLIKDKNLSEYVSDNAKKFASLYTISRVSEGVYKEFSNISKN